MTCGAHTLPRLAAMLGGLATLLTAAGARAQDPALERQLHRIFAAKEYEPARFGPAKWLDGGSSYTTLEPSETTKGAKDLVRYATASGEREVLVDAARLVPAGATAPLEIEDYAWSEDQQRLLLFTNTKRVWRRNTRGDYWVLERASGSLKQLGGDAEASSLMFARFSPDATRIAWVRESDLYVEELATGAITPLTSDGSDSIVNGTSDWVYEEELGVRDGFRWSPDGRHIAYWRFDSSGVGRFALINDTDTLYPEITSIAYPKVGTTNSEVKVGVVDAAGGETRWMETPGDPRDSYLARMEWAGDSQTLVLQQLNRLQNTNDVLLADVGSGAVTRIHRDQSDTWVEVMDEMRWLPGSEELLWLSEKDGWRHAYRVRRDGGGDTPITRFDADVIDLAGSDAEGRWIYFTASPSDATQRLLYRARSSGAQAPERVTPADQPGSHAYDLSPSGEWAFHTHSRFDQPPRVELVRLPEHRVTRVLVDNRELAEKLRPLQVRPVEFFRIGVGDGVELDGWMLKPTLFDPAREYPLLVFVYGEPAGTTVVDRWGGTRSLFHRALAEAGFVVVSFENRGTPAPRGAAWRKSVYGRVGELSARDQAAAVMALAERHSFVDERRVAIWGWSGGGSNTLNCLFRYPAVFKVGVSVAPVPDQTLYDTIYQERYMGLPVDNAEGYRAGSPIHFADGLSGKLLLIHGSGDDNVHYQGTERLVNRLVELGKPFDLMVYPNRSHAIREGEGTQLHIYSRIARYLLDQR